jgi:hypothetical protein
MNNARGRFVALAMGLVGIAALAVVAGRGETGLRTLSDREMKAVVGQCGDWRCQELIYYGCPSDCINMDVWYDGWLWHSYQVLADPYRICRARYWWEQSDWCMNSATVRCGRKCYYDYPWCAGTGYWGECFWNNGCWGTTGCG